mmetsp:Transcript_5734/g.8819  ORF Transcript_5734/g.8819 Transcript_5734/m.8819 type:complete len:238 (+) Transcript_5734:641-1354(+)
MAEPIRFLLLLRSTMSTTLDLSTLRTMSPLMTASATTLLPRPSIQFMAEGFFVGTHVTRQREDLHSRKVFLKHIKRLFHTLGDHVHAHRITSTRLEAQKGSTASNCWLDGLNAGKSRRRVECLGEHFVVLRLLNPLAEAGCLNGRWKAYNRRTGHAICKHSSLGATRLVDCLGTTVGGCHQTTFGRGHWDWHFLTIHHHWTSETHWNWYVAEHIFTARTMHFVVVIVFKWQRGNRVL